MKNNSKNNFNATIGNTVLCDGLLSMTDFIDKYLHTGDAVLQIRTLGRYKDFLKQPLKLEMFVPCDNDGNILEEPQMIEKRLGFDEVEMDYDYAELELYKKAKEKVLFKGFTAKEMDGKFWYVYDNNGEFFYSFPLINSDLYRKVEDLIQLDLELTESALNQLGL